MSYIFLNNKVVHENDAKVSVRDRGFLYGDGIFETLRSYEGYLFNIVKHFNRLKHSAEILKIPFDYSFDEIKLNVEKVLERNQLVDAYIRITLSRGMGDKDRGFKIDNCKYDSTFVIHVKPLELYPDNFYEQGIYLIVSNFKRSKSCPISCHKTLNFLTNIVAREEADTKGAHEAVLLNSDGYVAECSASNLFIVEKDTIVTPPLNVNILPGITRETVLCICNHNSIFIKEEPFFTDRIIKADECFLTNSLMEVMPVTELNGKKIGKKIPGKMTNYLMKEYKKLTRKVLH